MLHRNKRDLRLLQQEVLELGGGDWLLVPDLPVVRLHFLFEHGNVSGVEKLVGGRVLRNGHTFRTCETSNKQFYATGATLPSPVESH